MKRTGQHKMMSLSINRARNTSSENPFFHLFFIFAITNWHFPATPKVPEFKQGQDKRQCAEDAEYEQRPEEKESSGSAHDLGEASSLHMKNGHTDRADSTEQDQDSPRSGFFVQSETG
jgi:hypothetical protein